MMMTMKKMMMAYDHVEEVVHLCTKVANTLIKNKANISLDLSATPLVLCLVFFAASSAVCVKPQQVIKTVGIGTKEMPSSKSS